MYTGRMFNLGNVTTIRNLLIKLDRHPDSRQEIINKIGSKKPALRTYDGQTDKPC